MRLSPLPFAAIVREALAEVARLLDASNVRLVLFDDPVSPTRYSTRDAEASASEPGLPDRVMRSLRAGEVARLQGDRSLLGIPLVRAKRTIGALLMDVGEEPAMESVPDDALRSLADVFVHALARHAADAERAASEPGLNERRLQLMQENRDLRDRYMRRLEGDEIVAESADMRDVLRLVSAAAPSESPILIQGETGTGKELLARRIHAQSRRSGHPLVAVNCAALPPTLIEAELFGREKGAYTGALTRQAGRFEIADGSTLFLDEIGEIPLDLQAKLLRVLEEGRFERVGSTRTLEVDVRLVAATNLDLIAAVEGGRFRADLYFRLSVFPIQIPPLRSRSEDIEPLFWLFLQRFEQAMGRRIEHIPPKSLQALLAHPWPGNARELRNAVERAVILSEDGVLALEAPQAGSRQQPALERTLEEVQRAHIGDTLARTEWRIRGKGGAAEILGLKPTTLESCMARLGLRRPTLAAPMSPKRWDNSTSQDFLTA